LKAADPPIGVFFETENIFTLDENSEMSLSFIATLAQEESHTKSEIMNASIEMRFKRGIFLTPPLLGYDKDEDGNLVINEEEAKSIGRETTFDRDLTDMDSCREAVLDLCGQVGWRLRREHLAGHTVTLKVKFADFRMITRSSTGDRLIAWDEDIFLLAEQMLQKIHVKPGVRLLGVSVSSLFRPEDEPVLGFEDNERMQKRNQAIDALKSKFGENISKRGITGKRK
jgi:hypothetical protein